MLINRIRTFSSRITEYMHGERKEIAAFNLHMLKLMTVVYLFALLLYLLTVCLYQHIWLQTMLTYAAIAVQVCFTLFVWLFFKDGALHYKLVMPICILFGTLIMVFAIALGIWAFPDSSALAFPLLLICMSQIYTISPRVIVPFISGSAIVFLILSYALKPQDAYSMDLLSTVISYSISVSSVFALMHYKTAEYETRKKYIMMTLVDRMTGVLNKVEFTKRFESFISRMNEYEPYALAILDVDSFKIINDRYGHAFGDRVLIMLCEKLAEMFKKYPYPIELGRFGGDEFELLIRTAKHTDTLYADVSKLMSEVSRAIREELKADISFTVGIAASSPKREDFETMFHRADRALFHAKAEYKGGCCLYSEKNDN